MDGIYTTPTDWQLCKSFPTVESFTRAREGTRLHFKPLGRRDSRSGELMGSLSAQARRTLPLEGCPQILLWLGYPGRLAKFLKGNTYFGQDLFFDHFGIRRESLRC